MKRCYNSIIPCNLWQMCSRVMTAKQRSVTVRFAESRIPAAQEKYAYGGGKGRELNILSKKCKKIKKYILFLKYYGWPGEMRRIAYKMAMHGKDPQLQNEISGRFSN